LLFADDILVFCEANPDHLRFLRVLLVCFEVVFGLKVNLAKSLLVLVGNVNNVAELASILGCGTSSLPLKYLGMPLGARHKATSIWDDIVVKMERRLANWQKLYLSKGARVTLIKSTLFNLPTYFMSIFPIPTHVANCIEKLQRDFLWGGIGEEFKYHLVKWDKVCSPIFEGGLGFGNLKTLNRALLGKWLWRYGTERDAWWRVVVDSKYGSLRGGWCSLEPTGAFGVGVWKNIRKGWDSFSHYTRFVVGDGSKISFWHDLWFGDIALKVAFLALFDIARLKDAVVADNLERLGDSFPMECELHQGGSQLGGGCLCLFLSIATFS